MKRKDAIQKLKEQKNATELNRIIQILKIEAQQSIENVESNLNRARSITVGTSFGGTTEIMMRGDGGRHLWCVMQPVEVIELIHQLVANVGCNVQLTPRKDFSSWRDWRVSEAEKKNLNGHAPFVNDMAVFQKLGASGYNDEEAKQIMNILAEVKEFANENDDSKIKLQKTKQDGATNLMIGEEDGLIHNKLAIKDGKIIYMAGGNGGVSSDEDLKNETMAASKPKNGRKIKRTSKSA